MTSTQIELKTKGIIDTTVLLRLLRTLSRGLDDVHNKFIFRGERLYNIINLTATFVVKTAKDKKKTLKIFDKFFSILSNKVSLFIF